MVHTRNDEPRENTRKYSDGYRADVVGEECEEVAKIYTEIAAERCKYREAEDHCESDSPHSHEDSLEDSRYYLIEPLLHFRCAP